MHRVEINIIRNKRTKRMNSSQELKKCRRVSRGFFLVVKKLPHIDESEIHLEDLMSYYYSAVDKIIMI